MTTFVKPPEKARPAAPRPRDAEEAAGRLTTPRALLEAGLVAPERLAELEAVAERYAIGLTPALAG